MPQWRPFETFEPDYSDKATLKNWVEESGLWCTSGFMIGLFGSIIFVGYGFASFIINPLSDKFGRKPILLSATIAHCILQAMIMFITNQYARYVLLFFIGMTTIVRQGQSYILATEYAKKEHKVITGSCIFSTDGSPVLLSALYYMWVSQNWIYI